MFRTEDLAPLLAPAGTPELGFRAGTVLTWDASTGANTIEVAGATLTDVPILNTGEAIALKAGHVVALIRFRSSYFIMGRVTLPGSDQFASASVSFEAGNASVAGFTADPGPSTVHTLDIYGPAWADEALVLATVTVGARNNGAAYDYLRCRTLRDGIAGREALAGTTPQGLANCVSTDAFRTARGGFDTDPISLEGQVWTDNASWGATPGNFSTLSAIAVFRSTT